MRDILFVLVVFLSFSAEGLHSPSVSSRGRRRYSGSRLSHLVIPEHGGIIYLGGTNSLVQLDWSLEVLNSVSTGPEEDSPLCHASGCEAGLNVSTSLLDNVNKALVYDPENKKVIYCGSLHQGSCWKYDALNVSKQPSFIPEAVAANDASSSTYAFIGPQRYNRWGHGNVLYVGTTFTAAGDYRHDVPAISSRNLHNLRYAESNIAKQSLLRIDVKYRDRFLVDYVYGFNTSDHIYFITVQKKSHLPGEDERLVTRLARICISDANYDTYTEITLECNHRGETFNVVKDITFIEGSTPRLADELYFSYNDSLLMGFFSKEASSSNVNHGGKPPGNNDSALCIYSVASIEQQFEENLHKCFNGSMRYRNMEYISGPIQEGKCPNIGTMGNIDDFCKVGLKISGSSTIQEEAFGVIGDNITAFTLAELNNIPVIITGSTSGEVILRSLSSLGKIQEIQTLQDPNESPILDLHLLNDEVVSLQEDVLAIFNASDCNQFSTCGECLGNQNPFCGWCALDNKCSLKSLCNKDNSQWFSPGVNNRCIHLEKISPSALSISHSVGNIHLHVQSLPTLPRGQKFLCVFNDEVRLEAQHVPTGLTCPNPLASAGRRWRNADNISLSLAFTGSKTNLLESLTIPLYDCSKQKSCRQCSATYDCLWCMETSTCLASQMDCPSTALMDYRSLIHKYPCPALASIPKIPNDVPVGLKLPFQNRLPSVYKSSSKYWCLVSIENAKFKVSAKLVDSTVICEATQYNYFADVPEMTASLIVLVNENDVIDKANITIFKCSVIGPDCSLCKSSDPNYGCNWCNGVCASNCHMSNQSSFCPKPKIKALSPRSGPLEGGTPIQFRGTNLAIRRQDAIDKIYLGSKRCLFLDFKISVSLNCRNGAVMMPKNVSVVYDGHYSPLQFEYKDYYISHVSPSKGPMAGGTTISISGVNLDIGVNVRIFLDRVPCIVKGQRLSSSISCVLSGANSLFETKVIYLMIDGAKRTFSHAFSFTPNPVIHEIKPTSSFFSGGRIITIHGEHFDSVQEPEMLLHAKSDGSFVESSCYILNSRIMECETPSVQNILHSQLSHNMSNKATVSASTASNFHQFDVGFKMDNVTELLFLSKSYPNVDSKISFYEDPKYYPFGEGIKKYKGDELVLEGSKLNLASNQHDVEVNIGSKYCNVTSLTESQLVCFPPLLSESSEMPYYYDGRPLNVVVKVGKSLSFNLGEIVYDFNDGASFSAEVIGGISAAGILLIFLAAVGLILYRHKSSQAEREYKRIQIQMDTLENNVRSECKQAFAELQTDMTDLTSELESSGIPIREHRKYIMNVFFPGVTDHPILNLSNEITERKSFSLSQLDQLIHNKCFLLTLIDTLEKQPSFSIRDRVNFASLLTVVTLTNMEYLTDILRTLLLRLIEKSLSTRHPQLMLRRTESVVEKLLTNWLALCLYGYMKDYAGSSLFLLFKAIKYQIEKGPVDFITQEAKYSLSESGLLREPVSYSVITCYVLQREFEEAFQTRVLDCDTISQVKSKILNAVYKNTPFSMRPSVDEIDLEWQCGQDAHVVLQDFDLTTKESSVGKRVNTLAHYGVKGRAVVSLVPKQIYSRPFGEQSELSSSKCFLYHLKEPEASSLSGKSSNGTLLKTHKSIPEVFLTRLLSTKGTIQKFIDDFFATVFSINSKFPPIVKWLFDIFDDAAAANNVLSPEIIHSWKSNSVPLRFWVNIIKNPDFIFDIEKTYTSDSNLSIIAQAFMDSSSATEPKLNKESPSHKLLFAKDIMDYRGLIRESYELIQNMPPVSDQDLNYYMHGLSMFHEGKFNQSAALRELFIYVNQYYHDVHSALQENKLSKHLGLAEKLEDVYKTI